MKEEDVIKISEDVNKGSGKNPLEDYDKLKALILEDGNKALSVIWRILSQKIKDQLAEDKKLKPIIKRYINSLKKKIDKLGDSSVAYRFVNYDEFEEWKKELKKPYTLDESHTIFVYEVLYPVMFENMDIMLDNITRKGEECIFNRRTFKCKKCESEMVYRKLKDRFTCGVCKHTEPGNVAGKKFEAITSVGIDIHEIPNSEVYGTAWVKFLEGIIWNHVNIEVKRQKCSKNNTKKKA